MIDCASIRVVNKTSRDWCAWRLTGQNWFDPVYTYYGTVARLVGVQSCYRYLCRDNEFDFIRIQYSTFRLYNILPSVIGGRGLVTLGGSRTRVRTDWSFPTLLMCAYLISQKPATFWLLQTAAIRTSLSGARGKITSRINFSLNAA